MKKYITVFCLLSISLTAWANAPQVSFKYKTDNSQTKLVCDPKEIKTLRDVAEKVFLESRPGGGVQHPVWEQDLEFIKQDIHRLQKWGLSQDEVMALSYYSLHYYVELNSALREKSSSLECYNPWIQLIDSALKKLPVYSGTVYRVQRNYPGMMEQHTPGSQVTYEAYTSTSKTIDGYAGKANFIIYSKSCVDISVLNPGESEVLCPRGMKFKILRRIPWASTGFDYELEEIN